MKGNKKIIKFKRINLILVIALLVVLVSCNKKEDNNTLSFKQESDHFTFYSTDEDEKIIDDLEKSLEDNYERISKNLAVNLKKKVNVSIYPDIESFHNGIGMSDAEDWLVGLARDGEMFMVSPLNPGSVHTYDGLMKVIVHEYTHILVGEITNSTYSYLNEGIAVVESNQIDESAKAHLKHITNLNKLPSIDDMKNNYSNLEDAYQVSGGFAEFIVNEYGYEKMRDIIEEPENIEDITGASKELLEGKWEKYILENY